jgi:hypothetical protein
VGDGTKTNRQSPAGLGLTGVTAVETGHYQHGAQERRHGLDVGLETRQRWRRHDHEQVGAVKVSARECRRSPGPAPRWHQRRHRLGLGRQRVREPRDRDDRQPLDAGAGAQPDERGRDRGGRDHSLAERSDGTVWSGWNQYGQVGDGTKANNKLTPVQVTGLTGVTRVSGCRPQHALTAPDGMDMGSQQRRPARRRHGEQPLCRSG